ncbi:DMT family transporter [Paenibacillus sp. 481]|uniref:DMT family transporter n=1 Tax=Paenibacillus sp. 481 TaxID=2835869 RepID=UPI0022B360B4|nr:DMT family transporter [Paenibacillus sp. 481]UHA73623.1 DMT family transporter [Paenibacillus sp. 481]
MKNGVYLAICSSLIFSIMNALVKEVSATIPSSEVAFFRSIIGTVLIFAMMRMQQVEFSKKGIPMLALRGVLGALYLIAYFYTISKIPLTDASILAHLSPVFVIVVATLFLKEKLSKQTIWLLVLAFVGAILLVKPFNYSTYSIYAFVGVLSALFAAGAATSIRYLSQRHHAYEIVFYFLATATVVSIPFMWNQFVMPSLYEWVLLGSIGVVSLIGQIFLTKAFTHENAIVVEVVRYIGILFNATWGFMFWSETPDGITVLGGVLIVAACIALSRKKKPQPTERPNQQSNQQLKEQPKEQQPPQSTVYTRKM